MSTVSLCSLLLTCAPDGSDKSMKDALLLINSTLDEVTGEHEPDFYPDALFDISDTWRTRRTRSSPTAW